MKAELKEKRPHSWRPRVCGWVLRDVNEEKLFGWASGHSSKYYAQRIQTLERQLEERKIYMEKNAEVVGAFITFNTTEAVDKVLFELKPTSLLGTVVASLLTDSGSFLYDTKLTHAEVDDQLDDGQQDMELPGSMRDAAKTVATRVRRITLNLTELAKKHSGQTKSPITEGEGRVSFSSEDHAPLRPTDAKAKESARKGRIRVEKAAEPDDYLWENLAITGGHRFGLLFFGWLCCGLAVLAAIAINVQLSYTFAAPPIVAGVYTVHDRKCTYVGYVL